MAMAMAMAMVMAMATDLVKNNSLKYFNEKLGYSNFFQKQIL